MGSEQHHRAGEIFLVVRSAPNPAERDRLVELHCGDDQPLRKEVERLLAGEAKVERYLSVSTRSAFPASTESPMSPPRQIGRYTILEPLGVGGAGRVYRARQDRPARDVAIKLLRADSMSERQLKRFEFEAEILGHLQHDGVAKIYEAGVAETSTGRRPYFAMELVEGADLATYAATHDLTTTDRLRLVAEVCDAVHHAHQKGVVHRDLKPKNIMVGVNGRPKVLDFGVARATDADLRTVTIQTDEGQIVGTVGYMSPEQAAGDSEDVDTRADVYALGVVLYELLTGVLPHPTDKTPLPETLRRIREVDPRRPSAHRRALQGDIETIVLTALAKERHRRYDSAASMAADIRRFLRDEPISARSPTVMYQFVKFARRNRGMTVASGVAVVALIAGIVVSTVFAFQEAARSRELTNKVSQLETATEFQLSMFGEMSPGKLADAFTQRLRENYRNGDEADHARFEEVLAQSDPASAARGVIIEQLHAIVEILNTRFADSPVAQARLFQAASLAYYRHGLLDKALATSRRALDLRKAALGEKHVETLYSWTAVGMMHGVLGQFEEAERYYLESLHRQRRFLGTSHKDTLTTTSNLASLYDAMKRPADAAPLFKVLAGDLEERIASGDMHGIAAMMNLADRQGRAGDAVAALSGMQRAYVLSLEHQGADHVQTIDAHSNVAGWLMRNDRIDEAIAARQAALHAYERVYGQSAEKALAEARALAGLLFTAERWRDVIEVAAPTLDRLRIVQPTAGSARRELLAWLARSHRRLDAYDESERLLRDLEQDLADTFAPSDHRTVRIRVELADTIARQGRLSEAEQHILETLERVAVNPELSGDHRAYALYVHAKILRDLGRFAPARDALFEAFGLWETDEDRFWLSSCANALADTYERWGAVDQNSGHEAKAADWRARAAQFGPNAAD